MPLARGGVRAAVDPVFDLVQSGVDGVAAKEVFLEDVCGPLPEFDAENGIDAIADRDDRVEIVAGDGSADLSAPFESNSEEILPSCLARPSGM